MKERLHSQQLGLEGWSLPCRPRAGQEGSTGSRGRADGDTLPWGPRALENRQAGRCREVAAEGHRRRPVQRPLFCCQGRSRRARMELKLPGASGGQESSMSDRSLQRSRRHHGGCCRGPSTAGMKYRVVSLLCTKDTESLNSSCRNREERNRVKISGTW